MDKVQWMRQPIAPYLQEFPELQASCETVIDQLLIK